MSPIFADGSWVVMSQMVTRKGEEIEVPCRLVQYAPPIESKKNPGETYFPKLGANAFYQVTLMHVKGGGLLKIKNNHKGWRITFPDSLVKENWWDTKPTKIIKGDTTNHMTEAVFLNYATNRFGKMITNFMVTLIKDTAEEMAKAA